ncbi:hypothetical protein [Streptomyces sp. NPDC054975]
MAGGDDGEGQEAALAALREYLRDALGRKGLARKDIVARTATAGMSLSPTTISLALNAGHPAPTWPTVTAIAQALGADESALARLRQLWLKTQPQADTRRPATPTSSAPAGATGRPGTVETAGPGLLEVHQAPLLPSDTDTDSDADTETDREAATDAETGPETSPGQGLTPYLPRPHDREVERLLKPALDGSVSAFVVLTGDSSTGKTRALFDALYRLAPARPLWRPAHAAALADLLEAGEIAPGSVLWLNEAQRFLYGDRSEAAAAALRELLMTRNGVTAVGTLWTLPYWEDLTRPAVEADPRSQVRALLEAPVTHRVPVPADLTSAELSQWERLAASSGDPRMARAVRAGTTDGRVVQHLSGGPRLLAAYRMGPGAHFTHAEHALVTAAVVARQLGHYPPLSEELLTHAADGALPPRFRPAEPDWARAALTSLTTGVRADGRRTDIRNALTALVAVRATSGGTTAYEPADYLHQSLHSAHAVPDPTPALWDALTAHTTDPYALNVLSIEAQRRDFLKQAVLLLRRAAAAGHPAAWKYLLLVTPQEVGDRRDMALWMAEHAGFDSVRAATARLWDLSDAGPDVTARLAARVVARVGFTHTDADEVGGLFRVLRELGHEDMLLDLDPAARVRLTDETGALRLLGQLLDAGYTDPAARLTDRLLSRGTPLRNPWACQTLLKSLRICGHRPEEWAALSLEAARQAELFDLQSALGLAEELSEAGQAQAAHLLAHRIADAVEPDDTHGVASTMYELRCLGMTSACRHLAERAVPRVVLEDPEAVGWLLEELANSGLDEWVETLLARDPLAEVVVGPVTEAVVLLWSLQAMGREDLVRRMVLGSLAYVEPDEAEYASYFLDVLALVGRPADVTRFALRAVEEVPLSRVPTLGFLARSLQAHQQGKPLVRLARRAVAAADPLMAAAFVDLLGMFRARSLDAHAHDLIERAASHPGLAQAVAERGLLSRLRDAGETEAADRLEAAAPSRAGASAPEAVAPPRAEASAPEAVAPPRADAPNPVLATPSRAESDTPEPAAPSRAEPRPKSPYGLETDGTPAAPWNWNDLDRPGRDPGPGPGPRTLVRPQPRHDPQPPVVGEPDPWSPWPSWERYADN